MKAAVWIDDKTLLVAQGQTLKWLRLDQQEPVRSLAQTDVPLAIAVDAQRNVAAVTFANTTHIQLFDVATASPSLSLRRRVEEPSLQINVQRSAHEVIAAYRDRTRVWDLASGKLTSGMLTTENRWDTHAAPTEAHIAVLESPGPRGTSASHLTIASKLGDQTTSFPIGEEARSFVMRRKLDAGFISGPRGISSIKLAGTAFKPTMFTASVMRSFGGADVMALSPDEQRLAVGADYGQILLFDVASKQQRAMSKAMPHEPVRGLEFSPNGKQLAAASMGGDVWLLDAATLKHTVIVKQTRQYSDTYRFAQAFSPDGKWLAASGDSAEVVVVDVASRAVSTRFRAGGSTVSSLGFTTDGRFLISGTVDGALRLWRTTDYALVASLIAVDESDFLIVTPDNYYMASRGALNAVAFKRGNVAYAFEQFDSHLNRPDLVLERLGYASPQMLELLRAAVRRRMARASVRPDVNVQTLFDGVPEVRLDQQVRGVVADKTVTLPVSAIAKQSLTALNIWVNDVPLRAVSGQKIEGNSYRGVTEIPLSVGRNRIQVSVTDQRGVESKRLTIAVRRTGERKSTTYYVGLGVSDYADDTYDLTYAAKDASNLGDIFAADGGRSLLLLDKQATKESLAQAHAFLMNATEDDLVVVFVAGHGLVSADLDYYFATYDIDFGTPETRGIRYEALEALFDGLRARQRLLLMDTCHSGEIDKPEVALTSDAPLPSGARVRAMAARGLKSKGGNQTGVDALLAQLFSDVRKGVGAVAISSSAGTEFAIESSELKNGVFTYAWKEALRDRKADRNGDGSVQVSEAREYVFSRVRALTAGQQNPTTRRDVIENDFTLMAR